DDPGDRARRSLHAGPLLLRPAGGLRARIRGDADRAGAARDLGLRVRAPDGPDEPPPGLLDRDRLPDGQGGVLLRLQPPGQGSGRARGRCQRPGPRGRTQAARRQAVRVVGTPVRVRNAETDRMGIVCHAHDIVWFEIGRTDFCRAAGEPYRALEDSGLWILVTGVDCKYRGSAKYDDALRVRTTLPELASRGLSFR